MLCRPNGEEIICQINDHSVILNVEPLKKDFERCVIGSLC